MYDPNKMSAPMPSTPSVFDPNEFAQAVEGVGSTSITPIPPGEYLALVGSGDNDVKPSPFTDPRTNETRLRLDVTFELIDDSGAIRSAIDGRDPRHTQAYFLDLVPGTWKLDMSKGKNVQLNRLREAVGQNTGQAWVYTMLKGAGPLKLVMSVEQDKQDKDVLRNRIKSVGKPSA